MSKILAKNDLLTNGWTVTLESIAPTYAHLYIGFTGDAVEFSKLRFGYVLRKGESFVQSEQWPPPNVTYKKTDQQYIAFDFLNLQGNQSYSLSLWMEANGERFESITDFTTPEIPNKPLTRLQFFQKFTAEEKIAFETLLADARAGVAGLDATTRGNVLVIGRSFEAAKEIVIDDPETVLFVNSLVSLGILTQSRADEILTTNVLS